MGDVSDDYFQADLIDHDWDRAREIAAAEERRMQRLGTHLRNLLTDTFPGSTVDVEWTGHVNDAGVLIDGYGYDYYYGADESHEPPHADVLAVIARFLQPDPPVQDGLF